MTKKIRIIFLLILALSIYGCASMAASAAEYYSIGMAYFELGKYEEAEKWLNRAAQSDRTMTASKYNLGRLAYEQKRYEEAAKHFEDVLKVDPDNVLALKAAAYTRIKTGDIDKAEKHYSRLLELVPESADDGYNHALVLYAMERYSAAEEVMEKYPIALEENKDVMLLYARSRNAQKKIEAIDSFAKWLSVNSDPKVRYEYAQALERHELYARALEEYRKALSEVAATSTDPHKSDVRFALARALLIAEAESGEGITEMQGAVTDGFSDVAKVEELLNNGKISAANRTSLRGIVDNMKRTAAEVQAAAERTAAERAAQEESGNQPSEINP